MHLKYISKIVFYAIKTSISSLSEMFQKSFLYLCVYVDLTLTFSILDVWFNVVGRFTIINRRFRYTHSCNFRNMSRSRSPRLQ